MKSTLVVGQEVNIVAKVISITQTPDNKNFEIKLAVGSTPVYLLVLESELN